MIWPTANTNLPIMVVGGQARIVVRLFGSSTSEILVNQRLKIRIWNATSLYKPGKAHNLVQKLQRMNINILGISETYCPRNGSCHIKKHIYTIPLTKTLNIESEWVKWWTGLCLSRYPKLSYLIWSRHDVTTKYEKQKDEDNKIIFTNRGQKSTRSWIFVRTNRQSIKTDEKETSQ